MSLALPPEGNSIYAQLARGGYLPGSPMFEYLAGHGLCAYMIQNLNGHIDGSYINYTYQLDQDTRTGTRTKTYNIKDGSHHWGPSLYKDPNYLYLNGETIMPSLSNYDNKTIDNLCPIVFLEGESDFLNFINRSNFYARAVCIPGANMFDVKHIPDHIDTALSQDREIYIMADTDPPGYRMADSISRMYPRAKIINLPYPYNDFSDWCVSQLPNAQRQIPVYYESSEKFLEYLSIPNDHFLDTYSLLINASYVIPKSNYTIKRNRKPIESKYRTDILNVISKHVTLTKSGGEHRGLCPFHEEHTPSFFVNPDKGLFYCHGCGEGGDAITFIMKKQEVSFVQALEIVGLK